MSRINLIDLEIEYSKIRRQYLEDAMKYLKRIKDICKTFDPECRVIVFGSYVRGDMKPDSDIDILVITNNANEAQYRGKLRAAIAKDIGLITPFEIHIVTNKEYEDWYKKFIDIQQEIMN